MPDSGIIGELHGRQDEPVPTGNQTFGIYRPERLLASQGPMQTWLATDQQGGNQVVLKLIDFVTLQGWNQLARFEREQQVLRRLQHPGLPRLLDAFSNEQELALVIEYLPGTSLYERLAAGWRPGLGQALRLADRLLDILAYLHGFSPPYVHRDLKPSNVLLGDDGQVWLIDFGAVQLLLEPEGGATVVGSFGYMPPEQFCGQAVPGSDLYGLGATLIHLIARRSPAEMQVSAGRLRFGPYLEAPAEVKDWLARLVAPLGERYASAAEARQALQPLLQKFAESGKDETFAADFSTRAASALAGPGEAIQNPALTVYPPIRPLPSGLERLSPTRASGSLELSEPARIGQTGQMLIAALLVLLHLGCLALWLKLVLSGVTKPFQLTMFFLMPLFGLDALLLPLCQRRSLRLQHRSLQLVHSVFGLAQRREISLAEIQDLSVEPSLTSDYVLKLKTGSEQTALRWLNRREAEALRDWLQEVTLEERHG